MNLLEIKVHVRIPPGVKEQEFQFPIPIPSGCVVETKKIIDVDEIGVYDAVEVVITKGSSPINKWTQFVSKVANTVKKEYKSAAKTGLNPGRTRRSRYLFNVQYEE